MTTGFSSRLADIVLDAYSQGIFPMAENAQDQDLFWCDPVLRGIIPLDKFHLPRRLKRTLNNNTYQITYDQAFEAVIDGCAETTANRPNTWINQSIRDSFVELHHRGYAHSIEVWHEEKLSGGVYGLKLGAAFFGESMFHRVTNASKIALAHLLLALRAHDFALFDCQFTNPHLEQFGVMEIPRASYQAMLHLAIQKQAEFPTTETQTGGIL